MTDKSEQRIFSYLRRSTKKGEQEASIERQKVCVSTIAENLGINLDKIEYFIDNGRSGYTGSEYKDSKNETIIRKRKGYNGMIEEIRKQKVPCKILVWGVSRIARDLKEGHPIYNLLGNNKKNERKIESIHFSGGAIWNQYTTLPEISRQIAVEEESSREKSVWKAERINQALSKGLYANELTAPKGLQNMGVGIKAGGIAGGKLKETDDMPFIKKVFEMKAEGASNKKIHSYLKRNGISVYIGKMYESIFSNTVYKGYYIDKITGEVFDLKYVGGKKPITASLFNKAQESINKKSGKYGDKQKYDLLANLLRTSQGRTLSVYTPKNRTAKQYQNATEKVYISQKKVFKEFEDVLNRIYFIQYQAFIPSMFMLEDRKKDIKNLEKKLKNLKIDKEKKDLQILIKDRKKYFETASKEVDISLSMSYADFLDSDKREYISKCFHVNKPSSFSKIEGFTALQELKPNQTGFFPDEYMKSVLILESANKQMKNALKEIILKNGNSELFEQEEENKEDIEELEKEKKGIDNKIEEATNNGILNGFTKDEINKATKKLSDRKYEIDDIIKDLQNNSITEQDLDRFIDAIQNIFEHISNMHTKGIEGVSEEDMLHLIKLTTFELKIKPSKELDIGLFEGLKNVFYGIGNPKGFDIGTFRGLLREIDLDKLKEIYKLYIL